MSRYYSFSDKVNDIINDAVHSMNFGNLGRDINDAFRNDYYDGEIKLSRDDRGREDEDEKRTYSDVRDAEWDFNTKVPVDRTPKGRFTGNILRVIGFILAFVFGIAIVGVFMIYSRITAEAVGVLIICGIFCGAGVGMIVGGTGIRSLVKRFRQYAAYIGDDEFVRISDLAANFNKSEKYIVMDLRKMINKQMFPEGHIDDRQEYFIGNNKTYKTYRDSLRSYEKDKKKAKREAKKRAGETPDEKELRKVLEQGMESIAEIHEANDLLPGEHISAQLDTLEELVGKIFKRVAEKPSLLSDIKKFMDYYLPTTLKLVRVYTDFEKQDIESSQVKKARTDIENTLDTITDAFRKLLDELYKDTVMDVSADISVLKTMFAKDGLSGSDFDDIDINENK